MRAKIKSLRIIALIVVMFITTAFLFACNHETDSNESRAISLRIEFRDKLNQVALADCSHISISFGGNSLTIEDVKNETDSATDGGNLYYRYIAEIETTTSAESLKQNLKVSGIDGTLGIPIVRETDGKEEIFVVFVLNDVIVEQPEPSMLSIQVEFRDIFDELSLADCSDILLTFDGGSKTVSDSKNAPITEIGGKECFYRFEVDIINENAIASTLASSIDVKGVAEGRIVNRETQKSGLNTKILIIYIIGALVDSSRNIEGTIYVHNAAGAEIIHTGRTEVYINNSGTPIYTDASGKFFVPSVYADLSFKFKTDGYYFDDYFLELASANTDENGKILIVVREDGSYLEENVSILKSFVFFNDATNAVHMDNYYRAPENMIELQIGEFFDLSWCIRYFVKDRSTITFSSSNNSIFTVNAGGMIDTEDGKEGAATLTIADAARPQDNTWTCTVRVKAKALKVKEVLYVDNGADVLIKNYTFRLGQTYNASSFKIEAGYYLNGYFVEDPKFSISDFLLRSPPAGDLGQYMQFDNNFNNGFSSFTIIGITSLEYGCKFGLQPKENPLTDYDTFVFKTDFSENAIRNAIRQIYSIGNITATQFEQIGTEGKTLNGRAISGTLNSLADYRAMPNVDTLDFSRAVLPNDSAAIRAELLRIILDRTDISKGGNLQHLNLRDSDSTSSKLKDLITGDNYSIYGVALGRLKTLVFNYMSSGSFAIDEFLVYSVTVVLNIEGARINTLNLRNAQYIALINAKNSILTELLLPPETIFGSLTRDAVEIPESVPQEQREALLAMCGGVK